MRPRRFLFIVQGEGRGHLTQALALRQLLGERGDQVVHVLVGRAGRRTLPLYFSRRIDAPVSRFDSPFYVWDRENRSLRIIRTVLSNLIRAGRYLEAARQIALTVRRTRPDVIINFYDVVGGLYSLVYRPGIPIVCVGHQYLFLHPQFRFPAKHPLARVMALWVTRLTALRAAKRLALSFYALPDDPGQGLVVVPPLLRSELFALPAPSNQDFILIYLLNSGYVHDIVSWCARPHYPFIHCFCESPDPDSGCDKVTFHKLDDLAFLKMMASCRAVVTTAGFESVCEACYLGKTVYAVPVRNHIDHLLNAHDLQHNAGLGLSGRHFDAAHLLDAASRFSADYQLFRKWVHRSREIVTRELN